MRLSKVIVVGLCCVSSVCLAANKRVLDIQKWKTQKGAQVYFVKARQLPIVDIKLAFAAGAARDGLKFGVASLTNGLLNQGSNDADANQIAKSFDEVGAVYEADAARDMAEVSLRSLSDKIHLDKALQTFEKVIGAPAFPVKAFDRERKTQLLAIKQKQQEPSAIAADALYSLMYRNHPYGHPILGTPETVAKLTPADVRDFYKRFYVANNAVIAIVGDLDKTQARAISEDLSNSLEAGKPAEPLAPVTKGDKRLLERIQFPSTQTKISLGQPGISRYNDDYIPLMVGNYVLGGGAFVSRLMNEVREKRGLSYSIYSQFVPMSVEGPFLISLGTRNSQANAALDVTEKTLDNFLKNGPTQKELDAAKKNLSGGFALRLDSNKAIVRTILMMAFYELPDDYLDSYVAKIEKVTIADVKTSFNKYVNPNALAIVSVGDVLKSQPQKNG